MLPRAMKFFCLTGRYLTVAVARKYKITLEPLKYSEDTKNEEPLWHNRLMTKANYQKVIQMPKR